MWGGSVTWAGTNNPVANTAGAAYYKIHERALYGDLTLNQDLGAFLKGLSATLKMGYDTYSTVYENHSKTYAYSYYTGTDWSTGSPVGTGITTGGQYGTQSQDANTNAYTRRLTFNSGLNYEHYFPAVEMELVDYIQPAGQQLLFITPRMLFGLQPFDQGFTTNKSTFVGLLECKIECKTRINLNPYVELSAKSKGWVAGNEYLNSNLSLRLGASLRIYK